MTRRAAVRVLVGMFLVLVPLLLLIEGRRAAREVLAIGLIVGVFLVLGALRRRPRRDALRAEAKRLGLRFSATDPFAILAEPFELFRWTRSSYAALDHVLWGTWNDLPCRLFDYAYTVSEHHERRLSCALAALPGGWPTLVIRPESALTRLAGHIGLPGVELESEDFNRTFDVRSEDPRFANALVDARMMAWLLELGNGWGFEIRGTWILGYRDQVQPWELDGVLETVSAFIDRIPRAVGALFPEALPERPDVRA
jgi:hypothetical protein